MSLLQGFLPAEILARLDLSTLKPMPTEHITPENKERKNDLLWKAKYGDAWCYLLIMLEFQSVEDWWMAVRISTYSSLILQDIIKYEKLKKGDKLPLIFPFVIYNGDKKWQSPQEINQLIYEHDQFIDIYQPHQKYYLLDIKHLSTFINNADNNLSMQIFNFENALSIENIIQILANLKNILPEHEKSYIHEAFINLLSVNIINDPQISQNLIQCKTVQEAYDMLAENAPRWKTTIFEAGRTEGRAEGRAEGRVEGRAEGRTVGKEEGRAEGKEEGIKSALQTVLSSRFGLLSKELISIIDKITNVNTLQSLIVEATVIESLNKFMENINNKQN